MILVQPENKRLRVLVGVLSGGVLLVIGFFRERHVFNFIRSDLPFLVRRSSPDLSSYPFDLNSLFFSFTNDPRWMSTVFQILVFAVFTALLVYVLFCKIEYFYFVLLTYGFFILICSITIGVSLVSGAYDMGYGLAQRLKNIIESPYTVILFVPIFRLYDKGRLSESKD